MSLNIKPLPPITVSNSRDSVFVDSFAQNVNNSRIIIDGCFNTNSLLGANGSTELVPFHLIFQDIAYFSSSSSELKKYEEAHVAFFELIDSHLLEYVPESKRREVCHFVLFSYDFIYDIISRSYDFGFDSKLLNPLSTRT